MTPISAFHQALLFALFITGIMFAALTWEVKIWWEMGGLKDRIKLISGFAIFFTLVMMFAWWFLKG